MSSSISCIRYKNDIDLYQVVENQLIQYYANPRTAWQYEEVHILQQLNCASKVAAIRHRDYIDIYFIDTHSRLCHAYCNPQTNWQYCSSIIYHQLDPTVNPLALRFYNNIDIYCVDNNNQLIHLFAGDYNGWKFKS